MKCLLLLLFIPFTTLCQKENQFLTSQEGIFIEQNNQGKFGIVNAKGEVLVPIVNEYIKELWQGGGFIVYEKVTLDGPDYKEGVLRFYDKNVQDVFSRTFTRISSADENTLICYDKHLCGVYSKSGEVIAPVCFSEIVSLHGKLFWFEADARLRGKITDILSSKSITEEQLPPNSSAAERDGYNRFQGVFDLNGKPICNERCRIVEIITYDGDQSLFAVQNHQLFMENDGAANFAIMNGHGELVSDYIYFDVFKIDGQIIGEISTDEELKRVPLNNLGLPIK